MGLLIFGLIILIVGLGINKNAEPLGKFKSIISIVGVVVMALSIVLQSVQIVDAGHVGVKKLFGDVQDEVLYEGLNFVNPLVDVVTFSTQTQNYTMASTSVEGKKIGDDAVPVLSKDGLQVIIDLTVLYKVIPTEAPGILQKIGIDFEEKIIRPVIRSQIRETAVDFDAIELYSDKRAEFENMIKESIAASFLKRGFTMEDMLVRKIDLPESVKKSIERKITAIQEAQRMEFVLEKEKKEAQRKREEAAGIADAQKIINQGLTPKLIEFERVKILQELVKSGNSSTVILGEGKNTPIILDTKK